MKSKLEEDSAYKLTYGSIHEASEVWDNDDKNHWKTCAIVDCDEKFELAAHHGGMATCTTRAKCVVCGQGNGELAKHTGGTATCTVKAKCVVCLQEYGDLAMHKGGTATCTAKARCGVCLQDYGDFADHTGGTATCIKRAECEVCFQEYGGLAEHHFGEWNIKTPATCTEKGLKMQSCQDCSESRTAVILALGHDYGEGIITRQPTLEVDGEVEFKCKHNASHIKTEALKLSLDDVIDGDKKSEIENDINNQFKDKNVDGVYDVGLKAGGVDADLNGDVTISMPIPENLIGKPNLKVLVKNNDVWAEVSAEIKDNTITFKVSRTGVFALVSDKVADEKSAPIDTEKSLLWLWITLPSVVVVGVAVLCYFVIKNKKQKKA